MTQTVPPGNPEAPTTPAATAPDPAASASGQHEQPRPPAGSLPR